MSSLAPLSPGRTLITTWALLAHSAYSGGRTNLRSHGCSLDLLSVKSPVAGEAALYTQVRGHHFLLHRPLRARAAKVQAPVPPRSRHRRRQRPSGLRSASPCAPTEPRSAPFSAPSGPFSPPCSLRHESPARASPHATRHATHKHRAPSPATCTRTSSAKATPRIPPFTIYTQTYTHSKMG